MIVYNDIRTAIRAPWELSQRVNQWDDANKVYLNYLLSKYTD